MCKAQTLYFKLAYDSHLAIVENTCFYSYALYEKILVARGSCGGRSKYDPPVCAIWYNVKYFFFA